MNLRDYKLARIMAYLKRCKNNSSCPLQRARIKQSMQSLNHKDVSQEWIDEMYQEATKGEGDEQRAGKDTRA